MVSDYILNSALRVYKNQLVKERKIVKFKGCDIGSPDKNNSSEMKTIIEGLSQARNTIIKRKA